ncbi:MAG: hypothetical protein J5I47_10850 [Vicingus serpentipes]|nr:hypothetical protein [Vicingus serpentipes]
MVRKLLFSFLALFMLSFVAHKFYVSNTDIAYNKEQRTFEISIKFIGHDLEHALKNAGVPNLYLGTDKEVKDANEYLLNYINKRFEISVNNKKVTYHFIGKEVNNDDDIYCYLETDKLPSLKEITIKNTLLTEVFELQSNLVHLKIGEEKIDFTLNSANTSSSHQLK